MRGAPSRAATTKPRVRAGQRFCGTQKEQTADNSRHLSLNMPLAQVIRAQAAPKKEANIDSQRTAADANLAASAGFSNAPTRSRTQLEKTVVLADLQLAFSA